MLVVGGMKNKMWRGRSRSKHLAHETKKDYIIRLAQDDPFLKIEEIAVMANTTTRYVRTILSEANLSLMDLREEYARKMEKYSELKILLSIRDSLIKVDEDTENLTNAFTYSIPKRYQLECPEWNQKKANCTRYLQSVYYHKTPISIVSLITEHELSEYDLEKNDSLIYHFGLNPDQTRLTSPEIEIGKLSDFLGDITVFDFSDDCSFIKIKTKLIVKDKIFGEEDFFFPSNLIKLTIPGIFSSILELSRDS